MALYPLLNAMIDSGALNNFLKKRAVLDLSEGVSGNLLRSHERKMLKLMFLIRVIHSLQTNHDPFLSRNCCLRYNIENREASSHHVV